MDRRQFLRSVGSGAVGAGVLSAASSGQPSEPARLSVDDQLPDRDVPTELVTPYADKGVGNPAVPEQTWVVHRFGWQTVADEGPEALQEFRDAATYNFVIDGEEVEETDRYWTDIQPSADGDSHYVRWEYVTPPKPPGIYKFRVEMTFEEPLRYPDGTGRTKLWDGDVTEASSYDVIIQEPHSPTLPICGELREAALAEKIAEQEWQGQSIARGGQQPGRWEPENFI